MPKQQVTGSGKNTPKVDNSKKTVSTSNDYLSPRKVVSLFAESSDIVTVALSEIILATADGEAGFKDIIKDLMWIATEFPIDEKSPRGFVWAFDKQGGSFESSIYHLRRCYLELEKENRTWLSERSIIAIANESGAAREIVMDTAGEQPNIIMDRSTLRAEADFFGSFIGEPWNRFEAITAFPSADCQKEPVYLGHYLGESSEQPTASKQTSKPKKRDIVTQSLLSLAQSFVAEKLDDSLAVKLESAGFKAFSFEEFASFDSPKSGFKPPSSRRKSKSKSAPKALY